MLLFSASFDLHTPQPIVAQAGCQLSMSIVTPPWFGQFVSRQWFRGVRNMWLHLWTSSFPVFPLTSFHLLPVYKLNFLHLPKCRNCLTQFFSSPLFPDSFLYLEKDFTMMMMMCHVVPVRWGRQGSGTLKAVPGCWEQWRRGHFLLGGGRTQRFPNLWVFCFSRGKHWPIPFSLALSCPVTSLSPSDQMTDLEVEHYALTHQSLLSDTAPSTMCGRGFVTGRRSRGKSGPAEKMAWRDGRSQLWLEVGWMVGRSVRGWFWIGWQRSCPHGDLVLAPSWLVGVALGSAAGSWWWKRSRGQSEGIGFSRLRPHFQHQALMSHQHCRHCYGLTPPVQGPSSKSQGMTQTCRQTSGRSPSWWCSEEEIISF